MSENGELKKLRKLRQSIKTKLTIFSKFLEKISDDIKNDSQNAPIIELQERLDRNRDILSQFDDIQSQIEMLLDDVSEDEYEYRSNFENTYFSVIVKAKGLLQSLNATSGSSSEASLQHVVNDNSCLKLPNVQLPKFNGNFENWLDFHDSFKSMIVDNPSIVPIQKFHYLKACLSDAAEKVIVSLPISGANFIVAWQLLCDRFNNEQLLIHNHIKAIFNIKSIRENSVCIRHLVDTILGNLRSLRSLGEPTEYWDSLIMYIVVEKLDPDTVKEWDKENKSKKSTLQELLTFLKNRAETLEKFEIRSTKSFNISKSKNYASRSFLCNENKKASAQNPCALCRGNHKIFVCSEFQNLDIPSRIEKIKGLRLCYNCLYSGHQSEQCKFGKCKYCSKKHHSLLHINNVKSVDTSDQSQNSSESSQIFVHKNTTNCKLTKVFSGSVVQNNSALLSTVIVQLRDYNGVAYNCRALLDCGSQSNFITYDMVSKLGLNKSPTDISVIGIAQVSSSVKFACNITIHSLFSTYSTSVSCLVVSSICSLVPATHFDASSICIPENIQLSDPNFNIPSDIDLLIGAGLFWDLLCVGQVKLGPQRPILHKTKLGWIISGPLPKFNSVQNLLCATSQIRVNFDLSKFWEIEECSFSQPFSQEELLCEKHFKSTYNRHPNGRFKVSIPFKEPIEQLGESRSIAEKQFYSLERKFVKNPVMKEQYVAFMDEYNSMGHMSLIDESKVTSSTHYYLPHHGVLKEDSVTTRLRVVFNGSSPTSSGISLNDLQMIGPVLQDDLTSILLRFRKHSYVVSADIAKMYRQILVCESQRPLQLIIWRADSSHPLQTFSLNTVTYGTASASYLATKCIHQLSEDCIETHPNASRVIARDFYVDNLLTGSNSASDLIGLCQEIIDILSNGCFPLRQWVSNNPYILEGIHKSNFTSEEPFLFGSNENSKTLGLLWCPKLDILKYAIQATSFSRRITKRSILSQISQIFDPLGLLSACVIKIKILLQRLWLEKLDWDQSVPLDVHTTWLSFCEEISHLGNIEIPRHVFVQGAARFEIHGFSDASELAYGAAIYIRNINENGYISVNLLCAKTKVAPLKKITLPRLELCGALVLSRLYQKVIESLNLESNRCFLWTDSTIVLGWIKHAPGVLKTFVGNRVSEIQSATKPEFWRHINGKDNPADLLSRGVEPKFLKSSNLWWHGPYFLMDDENNWPSKFEKHQQELPELKRVTRSLVSNPIESFSFEKFSSFITLTRVIAFVLRFYQNCLAFKGTRKKFGPLTTSEINNALICIMRIVQRDCLSCELNDLSNQRPIHPKSKILSLNPFLDTSGLIRVGGRLRNSKFNFDKKHPILLPAKHHVTILIFRSEHIRLLHAGPQHLLSIIRERFWPISGRNIAKKVVLECVPCFRTHPIHTNPIMGDLPSIRLSPSFPFTVTGVDYAGPFILKTRQGKNPATYKGYVSLFICLSIRAVHLELVTDLTTACFMAALRRFVARRGKPAQILSDNGTNFVGCRNELNRLGQFLKLNESDIMDSCTVSEINWKFIPAHSPHFGGIWEAGVKSMKAHLKRVLANSKLTYEDFSTILTQVEGVLNSRPLSPMSSDPSDLNPITPAHFLIGRSMQTIPVEDFSSVKANRLTRFEHLQNLIHHLWRRWSLEYVAELQQRQKWKIHRVNIQLGTLVLIKTNNQPPLSWQLGRVEELHPGPDGVTRVVTLRTTSGLIRRAVSNICPLPSE